MKTYETFRSWILRTYKRESVRQLAYIYSSRVVTAALRFAASIIVVRTLGAANVGLVTIASVIMGIATSAIELGLTTTMIRKLSHYIAQKDDENAIGIFRRIYSLRLAVSGSFMVLAYFLAPVVAVRAYGNADLTVPLRLAGLGAVIFNMYHHTDAVLRAYERFKQEALINVFASLARLLFLALFSYAALLDVNSTMIINLAEIFIGFAVMSFLIPKTYYTQKVKTHYPLGGVLRYSGWLFAFSIIFMLFDRLDVLMLGYFKQATEVGIYSVAFMLVRPIEMVPETLNIVFLPKVAKFTRKAQVYSFFRSTLKVTGLVGIVCLALIIFAKRIILTFYGAEYASSVGLFQILVGAFILLTVLNPINLVGHSLNKPQLFTMIAGINLVLNFTGNLIFIPPYGALGAAYVTLVSRVLGGIIGFFILNFYLNRWEGNAALDADLAQGEKDE
jgi:O-antigen/teichoic acid export membrane protein